jgi:hypothetical protein
MSLEIPTNTRKVLVEVNKLVTNKLDYQIMKNINEKERAVVIKSVCECEPHTFYEWEKDENKCSQCGKPIMR